MKSFNHFLFAVVLCLLWIPAQAQISEGGTPPDFQQENKLESTAQSYTPFDDDVVSESKGVGVALNRIIVPAITSFTIDEGVAVTVTPTVSLQLSFTGDEPTHYMVSENSSFSSASWISYNAAALVYTFTTTENGSRSLYVKVKNEAGESNVMRASIYYKTAPDKLSLSAYGIGNGSGRTATRVVTLNHRVKNGTPLWYSVAEDETMVGKVWIPYTATPTFTLSEGNGEKTVYFMVSNATDTSDVVYGRVVLDESITVDYHGLSAKLYPNPVETNINVLIDDQDVTSVTVKVYSVTGEHYLSQTFNNTTTFTVDLSRCPTGILLIRLSSGRNYVVKQLVKY
jgi:hypothetical protein